MNAPHDGTPTSVEAARAIGQEMQDRVAGNAETACPGFAGRAQACMLGAPRKRPTLSSEQMSDACLAAGIVPHDLRAFGPVIASLARAGLIEKAGVCARRRGHGTSGGNIWRLTE